MPLEQHIYEFSLYNSEVRDLIQAGERHNQLDDGWADQRYIQVRAQDEAKAKTEIERRYPERKGYVYSSVIKFDD
ncbi:MAG: hypothetical protein HOJ34_06730 [Kordiimonadaceae bacterium]|jgi:hypothetical protein|nr:hypothetical protein [Gammaproteobacteria bacterium]MBT5074752.1 hypothetical protein [Kordiimonadaceae bacterium]MBT6036211.1 hypothetical protein [Kordiimonadaceae bacterium]MBT6329462.1 hypothetical protein [Kordiimonadaceae bacterium]MBT7582907.1 hypothetical protein [Kordiimonadaceae bacterium]